jgi:hypothetical protein
LYYLRDGSKPNTLDILQIRAVQYSQYRNYTAAILCGAKMQGWSTKEKDNQSDGESKEGESPRCTNLGWGFGVAVEEEDIELSNGVVLDELSAQRV